MKLKALSKYLDTELEITRFAGDRFNGLKVKGTPDVECIGFATNCTFEVIDKAIKKRVDFLLVHHGGWKETDLDMAAKKWSTLKKNRISLYIAHIPLDAHKLFGTSKLIGETISISSMKRFARCHHGLVGVYGTIKPVKLASLKRKIEKTLKTHAETFKNRKGNCSKIGVVAGGQGINPTFVKQAKEKGCDTFIGGDAATFPIIYAKESKINLLLAGHTATELPAVKEFAKHIGKKFGIKTVQIREEML
jgi:dinuclear metal center YbgI/SA1388 family protein